MMRLKQIKLAGFKSFVDPTTVTFPGNLSGVVGPNGCGKSNIIDAVRWVMGESSAKYLRGESMSDVIFNGSTSRKPAGQASIELHFDNSDGGLGGAYATYAEIVIRRQVNLDGQSVYYLNGSVCRRRDITDIFLGTGLGPRSYAIIEQGIISRLIEAKPEELRVYLEEAAGISKYKERRRETETRLQHTRDNLTRLNDVRDELQKQLEHLGRQAATAEKYQVLKTQEKTLKSQLLALRANTIIHKLKEHHAEILQLEKKLEEQNSAFQALATERETDQAAHVSCADETDSAQKAFYQYNTELARVEQNLAHHRERHRELEQALSKIQQESEHALTQLNQEEQRGAELSQKLELLKPQMLTSQTDAQKTRENLQQTENVQHEWQSRWDKFNQEASRKTQQAQVEQTKIQHLEKHLASISGRMARLKEEHEKHNEHALPVAALDDLQNQLAHIQEEIRAKQAVLENVYAELQAMRKRQQEEQRDIDSARTSLQSLRGRHASLQALQEAALGKSTQNTLWLQKPRLAEKLAVANGWELAVETVLNPYLEAIYLENMEELQTLFAAGAGEKKIPHGSAFVSMQPAAENVKVNDRLLLSQLADQENIPAAVMNFLQDVYIAENFSEAVLLLPNLSENLSKNHASVITRDGIWLGAGWLRFHAKDQQKTGILLREKELAHIQKEIAAQVAAVENHQAQLAHIQQILQQQEDQQKILQKEIAGLNGQEADTRAQLKVQQAKLQQAEQRYKQLAGEMQELITQQERENEELLSVRHHWQSMMQLVEQDALARTALQNERDEFREKVQKARQSAQEAQQKSHQMTTQHEVLQTQLNSSQQLYARLRQQLISAQQKHSEITATLADSESPQEKLRSELNQLLDLQKTAEKTLQQKREALAEVDTRLRQLEKQQQIIDQARLQTRGHLEQERLQQESLQTRLASLQEQLAEMNCELEAVQQILPTDFSETGCEEQLHKTTRQIERLGPINLAAISEHATLSERKTYLDAQHEDLATALNTLEEAIRKIDKETRHKFKEIYEKVNALFQQLFPRIFGGGTAYLELTDEEDLLQTGVNVIARPPGKRNSTIHLLSGGEKALTAISLVFAIFQLNPAPFCMLDEVDAPLDDANIGRFCELVKEMSKTVQFIFISHNKVAIEMAEHLIGVTMHEAGVSRLVAVDMNAAVEMAAA